MPDFTGHEIFGLHARADFHGSVTRVIQGSEDPQQISHIRRRIEIQPVDRGSHGIGIGVAAGNDAGRIVDVSQDDASVNVPARFAS